MTTKKNIAYVGDGKIISALVGSECVWGGCMW